MLGYTPQLGGEIVTLSQQRLHFLQQDPSVGMGKRELKMSSSVLILKNFLIMCFCRVPLFHCCCFSAVLIYNEKLLGVIFHKGCH